MLTVCREFHKIKYDLKGHGRSHKAILAQFFLALLFISLIKNKEL